MLGRVNRAALNGDRSSAWRGAFLVTALGAAFALLSGCNLLGVGQAPQPAQDNGSDQGRSGERNGLADSSSEGASENSVSAEQTNSSEERTRDTDQAERPPAPAVNTRSDEEALVGRWGEQGCAEVIQLHRGGEFELNGERGFWMLEGDQLTLTTGGQQQAYTLSWQSAGVLRVVDEEGAVETFVRC
jgi:hypothetical protein